MPNQKTNKAPVYVSEAGTASFPLNYTAHTEKQTSLQARSFTEETIVLGLRKSKALTEGRHHFKWRAGGLIIQL